MKKLIITLSLGIFLNAQVIDKVVAVVNNIPVTSYDVKKLSKNLNISKEKALQILLDQKLIQSDIKKRGIRAI